MNGSFASHEPACAGRRAVPVNRRMRGHANFRMAIEAEIIVRREIDHAPAVDDGPGAGVVLMNEEERISETQRGGGGAQKQLFSVTRQVAKIEPG